MKRIFLLLLFTLCVAIVAIPQAPKTYFIDAVSGSNTNNGTTKSTPWKSHPFMQTVGGCAGAAPSYSHVAGDKFIFKGGVSWPAACFQMRITASGSSGSNVDYYGVDVTWFTGASFTRPKFDLAQSIPSGDHVININGQSSITIDNIEIVNQGINAQGGFGTGSAVLCTSCGSNVMVTNSLIHDWVTNGSFTNTLGGPDYPMGSLDGNIILDHTEVSDANGFAFNSTGNKITVGFGGACHNCQEIGFSKMHDIMAASFTVQSTHDTEFFNISQTLWDTAPPSGFGLTDAGPIFARPHTQVIEDDFGQLVGVKIYNNYIHDTNAGVTIAPEYPVFIYNNVLNNNANAYIYIDDRNLVPAQLGQTGYIVNNTMDCSNGQLCIKWIGIASSGSLIIQNNIFITNSSPVLSFSGSGLTVTQTNNYTMPTSEASSNGFTAANKYKPTSSDLNVAGQGVNLTSSCSGGLSVLCSDPEGAPWFGGSSIIRPTSGAWDIGAYVFSLVSDFSLSVSPSSLTILQGTNGTSTITVNPINGFNGNVNLSASGLSNGLSASFNPNPATSNSTLTLTASNTATPGTVTVTITGTSGSLTHTTSISVTVSTNCAINTLPTSIAFGGLAVDSSSSQSITITNTSTSISCTSVSIALQTGTQFSQNNNCPSTLNPNNSCTINVTFTPLTVGTKSDTIIISSNIQPVNVPISGVGTLTPVSPILLIGELENISSHELSAKWIK